MPDTAEHMDTAAEVNEVRLREGNGNPGYGFPSVCMSEIKACNHGSSWGKQTERVSVAVLGSLPHGGRADLTADL